MAKNGQNAMIKIWVLKVLRKICGGKMKILLGFIYFSMLWWSLHDNNDSLDHHTYSKVIHINLSLCSFFIRGLKVSLPLHEWSVHLVPLTLLLGWTCIMFCCACDPQDLYCHKGEELSWTNICIGTFRF